tara:strand:- start:224 stop:481 length:258 start_codon:yes stop_codon:yes gene_type:complete
MKFPKKAQDPINNGVIYSKFTVFKPKTPIKIIKLMGKIIKLSIADNTNDKVVLARIFVVSTIFNNLAINLLQICFSNKYCNKRFK